MAPSRKWSFNLTLPPSVNRVYHPYRGTIYKDDAALQWEIGAERMMFHQSVPVLTFTPQRVKIVVDWYFPDSRNDIDNRLKLLMDAIARRMGFDDRRVYEVVLRKHIDRHGPRAEVVVSISEETDGGGNRSRGQNVSSRRRAAQGKPPAGD